MIRTDRRPEVMIRLILASLLIPHIASASSTTETAEQKRPFSAVPREESPAKEGPFVSNLVDAALAQTFAKQPEDVRYLSTAVFTALNDESPITNAIVKGGEAQEGVITDGHQRIPYSYTVRGDENGQPVIEVVFERLESDFGKQRLGKLVARVQRAEKQSGSDRFLSMAAAVGRWGVSRTPFGRPSSYGEGVASKTEGGWKTTVTATAYQASPAKAPRTYGPVGDAIDDLLSGIDLGDVTNVEGKHILARYGFQQLDDMVEEALKLPAPGDLEPRHARHDWDIYDQVTASRDASGAISVKLTASEDPHLAEMSLVLTPVDPRTPRKLKKHKPTQSDAAADAEGRTVHRTYTNYQKSGWRMDLKLRAKPGLGAKP